jgi:hypothetical protein
LGASVPEVRFSGFVHYLGKVVGWQLEKWGFGENIFCSECKYSGDKGLGRGIFLGKLTGADFVAPACGGLGAIRQKRGKKQAITPC